MYELYVPNIPLIYFYFNVILKVDKHIVGITNDFWGKIVMTKVANIIEFIKIDVNKEESMILSIFQKMLQMNFKLILLFGIPLLIYVVMKSQALG